jgi:hypothetical protein
MHSTPSDGVREHQQVSVRTKLAAAWTSLMFLYVYVDILSLYRPGGVEDILDGVVWEFSITQTWAVGALTLMAIPIAMSVLTTTLPARACRLTTLGAASIFSLVSLFNIIGESWTYYYGLGATLEVAVLALIIRTAWTWPRQPSRTVTSRRADHSVRPPQAAPTTPRPPSLPRFTSRGRSELPVGRRRQRVTSDARCRLPRAQDRSLGHPSVPRRGRGVTRRLPDRPCDSPIPELGHPLLGRPWRCFTTPVGRPVVWPRPAWPG